MSTAWLCRCGKAPAETLRVYWFKTPTTRPKLRYRPPVCWEVGVECFECAINRLLEDRVDRLQTFGVIVEGDTKAAVVKTVMEQMEMVELRGRLPKRDVQKAVAWLKKAVRTDG